MLIPEDLRYGNKSYLNFSTLSKAIEYDIYGNRKFNPLSIYHKIKRTDAMQVGTIVDEHMTEGIDFYSTYKAVSKRSPNGPDTDITNSMYESVDTILKAITTIPGLQEELDECTAQDTLEDNTLQIKGKLDFYDPVKNHIIDLKCVGSIDNLLRDLYNRDQQTSFYHRYSRQLAWYSYLVEVNYGQYPTAELLAISHDGEVIRLQIPEITRRIAFAMLQDDMKLIRENESTQYQITTPQDREPRMDDGSDDFFS